VGHRRSTWSITAGSVADIPIRIHVTFLALLVWLVAGSGSPSAFTEALFVLLVFFCVLLHELGHALVAKRCGIQTRDITLYPFGGVASITAQPTAGAELLIALAGPLVNVCIALALYPFVNLPDLTSQQAMQVSVPQRLFLTNIALAAFNLLPALPMDGGRVLRALLTLLKVQRATAIAARVSQALCVLLAIAAAWFELPMLFIIALIIFAGAMQEHVRAEATVIAAAFSAKDAMVPKERLECFIHGTTVSNALSLALTSYQPHFPVLVGGEVVGIVQREDLFDYAATHSDNYIGEIVDRSIQSVDVATPLADALAMMEKSTPHLLQVTRDGVFVGLLSYDRVAEFLLMHEVRQQLPKHEDIEWQPPL
jgi:Zn-dependent protease/CBS domain-containing protein